MRHIIKVSTVSALAMFVVVAVASAAIQSGQYSGQTQDDSEPITIKVGKKANKKGKWVKDVFVEQSAECGSDLHFTKDDKIKNGQFKVVIKEAGFKIASVNGGFPTEGVISGTLSQVMCDGNDDSYVAFLG